MSVQIRVVFMGTPDFSAKSLQALLDNPDTAQVVAVYTQPDKPAGRGQKITKSAVKALAEKYGIPIFQPENINTTDEHRRLADFYADTFVVVAYAQFLGGGVLNLPRMGCINVHGSLLPKYRGGAPIHHAILNGEKETGITTIKLVRKMDAGPVIIKRTILIEEEDTFSSLAEKLAELGGKTLVETLQALRDRVVHEQEQDESLASYAPEIKKEDGNIDWNNSGRLIIRKVRAFDKWPGVVASSTRGKIKIHKARYHEGIQGVRGGTSDEKTVGAMHLGTDSLFVRCADGWIELLVVQPENKKPVFSKDFLNGIKNDPDFKFLI